jgi:cell division septation protein DedD
MSPKYLVAAVVLAFAVAPLYAQSVRAGIDEWQRGNYAQAVAIWRPLADAGDASAQFNLGQAYRLGRGLPTNVAESQKWFERAAGQGNVDAETTLGLLLFQNGDPEAGLKWLKVAAEQDEPRAMLVYGTALFNGDSVTQDPVLGYAYVRRSAAQGLAPARETLAQLDQLMSAEDRKKGGQLAKSMGEAAGRAAFASTKEPKAEKALEVPKAEPAQVASVEPPKQAPPKAELAPRTKAEPKSKPAPKADQAKPAPKAVQAKPAPKAVQAKPEPKPVKHEAAPATGAWRIQLGAFAQRGNAEALYKRVAGNNALAGRKPFFVPAGAVTRLQVGPFESKSAAAAACKSVGSACFPVPAK